jgi:hypothetical protein
MATTIYELLTGVKIDEATISQLDSATGRTFVDTQSIEFWQGVLTLSHVMKAARTYPHGLPIPETGSTATVTIADGANAPIKPAGTEVWLVQGINFDNCTAAFTDGDGNFSIIDTADAPSRPAYYLSSNLFLTFFNGSGSEQTPTIAYFKVSL